MSVAGRSIVTLFASLLISRTAVCNTDPPRVVLGTGCVEGLRQTTVLGRTYYSFRGIPYAEPPIGDLRFRAPQPPTNWTGVLRAVKDAPACLQPFRETPMPITYSEDCLYLNVFTPYLQSTDGRGLPVIVWIHGGKFYQGSSATEKYGVDFFLMKDVVLVLMNYRLGIFGYLNMNVSGAQGNAALKDVVLALKWVQSEISKFGGDPRQVTIVGDSSGSVVVSYLYVSPMSKGLFSRALSQSGSCLCDSSFLPSTASIGLQIAEALGCPTDSLQSVVFCLRAIDGATLSESQEIVDGVEGLENPFIPTIEQDLGEEVFLSDNPQNLLKTEGNLPYLMGFTSSEGLMSVRDPEYHPDQFEKVKEDFIPYLPFKIRKNENQDVLERIANRFQDYYIGQNSSLNDTIYGFVNYNSDLMTYCLIKTAQIISNRASVYLYLFNYNGEFRRKDRPYIKRNLSGLSHGDELGYLFYRPSFVNEQYNISEYPHEMDMVKTMISLWTNFAAYGNPTPPKNNLEIAWEPVEGRITKHLIIDEPLKMALYPLVEDRVALWDSIFQSLYKGNFIQRQKGYLVYVGVYFFFLFSAILGIACYFQHRRKSYGILD